MILFGLAVTKRHISNDGPCVKIVEPFYFGRMAFHCISNLVYEYIIYPLSKFTNSVMFLVESQEICYFCTVYFISQGLGYTYQALGCTYQSLGYTYQSLEYKIYGVEKTVFFRENNYEKK